MPCLLACLLALNFTSLREVRQLGMGFVVWFYGSVLYCTVRSMQGRVGERDPMRKQVFSMIRLVWPWWKAKDNKEKGLTSSPILDLLISMVAFPPQSRDLMHNID